MSNITVLVGTVLVKILTFAFVLTCDYYSRPFRVYQANFKNFSILAFSLYLITAVVYVVYYSKLFEFDNTFFQNLYWAI